MTKFLDGVDALGYRYNGNPGYLMSPEEYALFLSLIYDRNSANTIETASVELLPTEDGVLIYQIPEGYEGTLLALKVEADGFCKFDLTINTNSVFSGRNSYARPAVESNVQIDVKSLDSIEAKVTNISVFGQTNKYKIYLYLMLRVPPTP